MILKPRLFRKPRKGHWATKGLVYSGLFNEGSGNKVFDLSGNGNTGTRNGTGTIWSPGKFGSAQQFNGSDDYIALPAEATLAGQAQVTIVIWVKPTNNGNNRKLYDEVTSDGNLDRTRIGLEHDSTTIQLKWRDSAADPSGSATTLSTGTITNDVWQQVVGVYDSLNNSQKIYINGVEAASATNTIAALGTSTTQGIRIGNSPKNANYILALIDHVMVYTRALSAGEIAELYAKPFGMFERDSIELWVGATSVGAPPATIVPQIQYLRQMGVVA